MRPGHRASHPGFIAGDKGAPFREGLTVMVLLLAVENGSGTISWQRGGRYAAAAAFVGSSFLWFVSDLVSFAAHGLGRVAFTQAHPQLVGLAVSADMLSVPLMFGTVVVWYLLGRVASPRIATAGAVLLTCGTAGQAILIGVDVAQYVINTHETDRLQPTAFDAALNGSISLPFIVFFGLFYIGAFLGTLVSMVAVWRSRTLPRGALLLATLFLVASMLDVPVATAIELVACLWFALAILGAPQHRLIENPSGR